MTEKPPADFMNKVENVVIQFLKRYPNNMVPLGLVCEVNHVSAITGEELDVHLSNFRSQQESVYETTSLDEVYKWMRARILRPTLSEEVVLVSNIKSP